MNASRKIALLCSLMMLVFGLVACGEGSVASSEDDGDAGAEETAEEQAAEETNEPAQESDTETNTAESNEGEASEEDEAGSSAEANEEEQQEEEQGEAVEQSISVMLYYSDDHLMEIVEEERDIDYSERADLFQQLWEGLQSPENEQHMSLWDGFELVDMYMEGSQLTIDISKSEDVQFGSGAEGFALQTLLQTFRQIDDVQTIQILVDGQTEETLGGHVSINEPLDVDEDIYTGE